VTRTRLGPGALVLGGDYRALGVVRSLGRHGIPVWVVRSADDHALAGTSRYCQRRLVWPDAEVDRLPFLLELVSRYSIAGWTVFPTADATAAFVARHHGALGEYLRLTTPPWDRFRIAFDKGLTDELARAAGVAHPCALTIRDRTDLARYAGPFPAILKPTTKPRLNRPRAKAWPVRDRDELLARYDEVAALAAPSPVMVQELIPGAGGQLSIAAVCHRGNPVAYVVAERVRQYPMDFGHSSTYVETTDAPEVAASGRRVLADLGCDGPVEVEFKRDPRDGRYKLLDINARVWGWHTIGHASGLDFTYLAWRLANGFPPVPVTAPSGLRWLRLTTDLPVAYREIVEGRLSVRSYLRCLLARHDRAVAAADDPLPGMLEVPLFLLSRRAAQ
jgi:predicted ATP-grasp superfamily ATP-dependent carboligase